MKNVLLTGFEPFAGHSVNPSQLLLEELCSSKWKQWVIHPCLLPVDTEKARRILPAKIRSLEPHIILSMGQADGRAVISLERVAINLLDFTVSDNADKQIRNKPVYRSGPTAYFSRMPLENILKSLHRQNIPAVISNTAGTYLCNQVMYTSLHVSETVKKVKFCGFVHVPLLPEQVTAKNMQAPSMAFETMKKAMETILTSLR